MRKIIVGFCLFVSLGCAGLSDKIVELTGAEVGMGADAEHPADFPLPPPKASAELLQSMSIEMGGMMTATVQYTLPEGSADAEIMDQYEAHLKDAGHTPIRSDAGGSMTVVASGDDGTNISASITSAGGQKILSLVAATKAE